MANMFYEKDCDLGKLDGKKIAIIGYGSQGHAHALNLKESGCDVCVGLRAGSKNWANAEGAGLKVKAVAEAVRLLEKYDAFDRVILASFHSEIFGEFKRLRKQDLVPDEFMYSPGIMGIAKYFALMTLGIDSLYLDSIAVLQIPMEEYGFNFASKRLINTAHEHNLAVHYWTIDDEDEMRLLIELGADAIMTDNPSVLKKVLEEYK